LAAQQFGDEKMGNGAALIRRRWLGLLVLLCAAFLSPAWASARAPLPPPPPPPEFERGPWRNLAPEQRDAIRRLSQEQRQALERGASAGPSAAPFAGSRLSPEERHRLREQIRQDHERRQARAGGHRP